MKKLLFFCILLPFFGSAQNVKVTDYNVPVSSAQTLRFDGSWNWSQNGDSVVNNNANGLLILRTFYSSLPLAWFINVDAAGNKSRGEYSHNINLDASFRKYIWERRDWFGFTGLAASHAKAYKQIESNLRLGFGYGRYINATSLAKAVRIEDHLLRDEVIRTYFPKETILNVAYIIERENEYRDNYGASTYETYWLNDIEEEMNKSGVLADENIGSLGILRMRQVLFGINERVNQRYYGWDATIGFEFPLTTRDKSPAGNPNLFIGGRYSFPISWKLQVNTSASVSTPIDSLFFKEVSAQANVDFIYELSNRVNLVAGYIFGILKQPDLSAEMAQNFNASFWYYLENNIYLTVSGDYTKQPGSPKVLSTRVGLQYNLF